VADSVYRVTEVVGVSGDSWGAAAQSAVETAAHSVRTPPVAEVIRQDLTSENGHVTGFESASASRSGTRRAIA
jgi:dodecin